MMEVPPVHYTTTSDGVSIAWTEMGQGPALLWCGGTPFTHVQELPAALGSRFGALARSVRLITFDARGTGMSERDVADISSATLLTDAGLNVGEPIEEDGARPPALFISPRWLGR